MSKRAVALSALLLALLLSAFLHAQSVAGGRGAGEIRSVREGTAAAIEEKVEAVSISGTPPPESGNWTIYDTTIVEGETLVINGSVNVYGTLVLKNSKIYINCSYNGENGINTFPGANLTLRNTLISAYNTSNAYLFIVNGSAFYAEDSVIEYCGYEFYELDHIGLLIHANGAKLVNCTFRHDYVGALVFQCSNVVVDSCKSTNSGYSGLILLDVSNAVVRNCKSTFDNVGFYAHNCSNLALDSLVCEETYYYISISIEECSSATVYNCSVSNAQYAVYVYGSSDVLVRSCRMRNVTGGVIFDTSTFCTAERCYVCELAESPSVAAAATESSNVTFRMCDFRDGRYGVEIWYSDNCTFYLNNFVNNTYHALNEGSTVYWNSSQYGNYWDNYTGVDEDGDGIGDTPHYMNATNIDYLPLTGPWQWYIDDVELPTIVSVDWWPKSPTPDQSVAVMVDATDDMAVKCVFLRWYDGTWHQVKMEYDEVLMRYKAQIPPRDWQTSVTFYVIVYDFSGNVVTSPLYGYTVVPEFSPAFLVPFLALALVYVRRKLEKR